MGSPRKATFLSLSFIALAASCNEKEGVVNTSYNGSILTRSGEYSVQQSFPLARMAEYNVGLSGTSFASSSDEAQSGCFTQTSALELSIAGYHVPSRSEWLAVVPDAYTSVYYESASSAGTNNVIETGIDVDGSGSLASYTASYKTYSGSKVVYALRLKGGDNQYYSAWRYEHCQNPSSSSGYDMLKISARILGASGISDGVTLSDISNDSYWNADDVVTRFLPSMNGSYGWYWTSSANGSSGWCPYFNQWYAKSNEYQAVSFGFPVRMFYDGRSNPATGQRDSVVINCQTSYLRSLQTEDGAIRDNLSSSSKITPYFSSYAAWALCQYPDDNANINAVKQYFLWYFNHLNGTTNPVTGGAEVNGSVYDYYAPGETTNGTYDSVDSYAAMFLVAAKAFASVSNECKQWLATFSSYLSEIFGAMMSVMDSSDHLTYAMPSYPVKYLMDNCEVNAGLQAAEWLEENGLLTTSYDIGQLLSDNTSSILSNLYVSTSSRFKVAKSISAFSWNNFYPDAVAQLFPAVFGVIPSSGSIASSLYYQFNQLYVDWEYGARYDTYPWTFMSFAAANAGDSHKIDSYTSYIYRYNVTSQEIPYWYSMESACLLLAIATLGN